MRTKLSSILITLTLGSSSYSVAHAQTMSSAPPVAQVSAAPSSPAAADPNIDRGFLLPTAMTQPAGTLTYNNYELLLHGLTYGVTDRIQATVTVLSPIAKDMPFVGFGAVKARIVATDRLHLAVQGTLGYAHDFQSSSDTSGSSIYTLGAGGFGSLCLRDDCSSLLSASASYQMLSPSGADGTAHLLIYGGSIVHRVSRRVKLLGEVASAAAQASSSTTSTDLQNLHGVLVSYGVRFHTDNLAGDVGFVKPIVENDSSNFLLGFPFVNLSYRWQ